MKPYSADNHPGLATYLTGFILALLLTLLAFGLVIIGADSSLAPINKLLGIISYSEFTSGEMPRRFITGSIIILAILQILVHLRFFLHLNFGSSQKWNLQAILFTLFIIIIMVGGTLWIMNDLNGHMM